MRPPSHPTSRFWTPSSRSIISSARASASALTSAAGRCSRAISSDKGISFNEKPRRGGAWQRRELLELDALLGEVADRGGMPRDRGRLLLLVLQLDVGGLLVHADEVVAMLEHRLHRLVREVLVEVAVHREQVGDRRLRVVGF